jgi:hypothetical protein
MQKTGLKSAGRANAFSISLNLLKLLVGLAGRMLPFAGTGG